MLYLNKGHLPAPDAALFELRADFSNNRDVMTDFGEPPKRSSADRANQGGALCRLISLCLDAKLLWARRLDAGELMQRAPEADRPNTVRCGCALR